MASNVDQRIKELNKILQPELPLWVKKVDELQPREKIYREQIGGIRYYYTFNKQNNPRFYLSVTSLAKLTMPMSPFLLDWKMSLGKAESEYQATMRAHYGNMMHDYLLDFTIKGGCDPSDIRDRILLYLDRNNLHYETGMVEPWTKELTKDLLSWAKFCHLYELEPLAVEYPIVDRKRELAGRVDLVAKIKFGNRYVSGKNAHKLKDEEGFDWIVVMIDLKSGKNGFYDEHLLQLESYKTMWNDRFPPAWQVERIYNWGPKDWRSAPTFSFKDQTGIMNDKLFDTYVKQLKLRNLLEPKRSFILPKKELVFGEDVSGKYEIQTLADHVRKRRLKYNAEKRKILAAEARRRKKQQDIAANTNW
jgi:hypothetical protein